MFSLMDYAFDNVLRTLTKQRSQGFPPVVSSKSSIVLALTFRSVIHFELTFMNDVW